jgi:hypothetical protein
MKRILLTFSLICFSLMSFAQTPLKAGEVAPNFTYSDINGLSHTLYNYTDSGYTVIMDISATWCGPCWSVHNSNVFKNLTNQYGFSGSIDPKKIKVIFFEGDASTTNADLNGTGTNTQGNWVAGSNYTIIDNADIKTKYPIDGYPHFYIVCPNRMVAFSQAGYSTPMLSEPFWVSYMQSCPVKVAGTNVGTIAVSTPTDVCAGASTALSTKIQNLGTASITSATVKAKVGATTVATYNWSGSLNTYDFASVNIGNYTFPSGTTAVDYEVTTTGDVKVADNTKTQSSKALTSNFRTWTLMVKTDQYPGDLTWKVKNSTGTVIQQHTYTAGPGSFGAGGPDAGLTFQYPMTLNASECYTIELIDSYGDGLYGVSAAADTGYVKLFDDLIVTPLINFGAGFDAGATGIAKTGTVVNVEEAQLSNLNVYPNPASTEVFVSGIEGDATFSFVDVLGRTLKTIRLNDIVGQAKLNVSDLAKGAYVLKINQDGKSTSKSLVITE